MQYQKAHTEMALVRLKRAAQITLPVELLKRFHLEERDYLEAETVENGILLKPVSMMDREGRQAGATSTSGARACQAAPQ